MRLWMPMFIAINKCEGEFTIVSNGDLDWTILT